MDAILAAARVENGPARSYLARFLFRGEDVFKPVAELSGGERSRLELAVLGVTPANLLLLDEPTNHLDIPAREALESFLRSSESTMLIVSARPAPARIGVRQPVGRGAGRGRGTRPDRGLRRRLPAWRAAVADGWTVAGELELQAHGSTAAAGATMGAARTVAARSRGRSPPESVATRAVRPEPLSKDAYRRQRAVVDADLTRLGLRKSQLELALGRPDTQTNYVELRRLASELADVDAALAQAEDLAGPRGARAAMTAPVRRDGRSASD